MTRSALSYHLASLYPELQVQDAPLRDVISAMAAYDAARAEYQARNEHFGEWMHWYKENPAQKDRVVSFVVEHSSHFESTRAALQIRRNDRLHLPETSCRS